jgi:hypothetical protein
VKSVDRPRSRVAAALRRRGWIIPLAVAVVVVIGYLAASLRSADAVAESVLVVGSGASRGDPGHANEAERLASTYSHLIPQDAGVLAAVARRTKTSVSTVEERIAVKSEQPPNAILRVRYTGPESAEALAGVQAVASAVSGPRPASRVIPSRAVLIARPAHLITEGARASSAVPIAAVLGLCLGVILLLAFERADPRVDDVQSVRAVLRTPASSLGGTSSQEAEALMDRWRSMVAPAEARVALIPAAPDDEERATGVAAHLAEVAERRGQSLSMDVPRFGNDVGPLWEFGEASPQHLHGTQSAKNGKPAAGMTLVLVSSPHRSRIPTIGESDANLVVLVAAHGTRIADLRHVVALLGEFGIVPDWTLLVDDAATVAGAQREPALAQEPFLDHSASRRTKTDEELPVEQPYCGETKRNGQFCKQPAGYGTAHPGKGPCKWHGGVRARNHPPQIDREHPRIRPDNL